MTNDNNTNTTRRRYIKAGGAASAAFVVAGCLGGGDSDGDETTSEPSGGDETTQSDDSTTESSGGQELEIVHWWTAGGEKDALDALIDGFEQEYPEVEVTNNPAPGGAGSALDTEIQSRIINENPPNTFQIWPGKALNTYLESDVLVDISDNVWDDGMRDAYLDGVKQMSQDADGNFVAVPLNIHRLNNLFYNVDVLNEAGVDPASLDSPSALLDAMETIDAETDAAPMAHQTQAVWSTLQMWEDVLIGHAGVDVYKDVLAGNITDHEQDVKESLQLVVDFREYFNDDAGSVAWDEANSKVIQGDAGFMHQGDWAAGQYGASEDFEFEANWNNTAFPGTSGTYHVVADSFVMPTSNPSPEATAKWLSYAGSVDGQERFNPVKGSIPPRTDVPNDEFGPFLQSQREDFDNSDAQPPTIAHGTGVTPEVKSSVEGAFSSFIGSWNVDSTYDELTNAF